MTWFHLPSVSYLFQGRWKSTVAQSNVETSPWELIGISISNGIVILWLKDLLANSPIPVAIKIRIHRILDFSYWPKLLHRIIFMISSIVHWATIVKLANKQIGIQSDLGDWRVWKGMQKLGRFLKYQNDRTPSGTNLLLVITNSHSFLSNNMMKSNQETSWEVSPCCVYLFKHRGSYWPQSSSGELTVVGECVINWHLKVHLMQSLSLKCFGVFHIIIPRIGGSNFTFSLVQSYWLQSHWLEAELHCKRAFLKEDGFHGPWYGGLNKSIFYISIAMLVWYFHFEEILFRTKPG